MSHAYEVNPQATTDPTLHGIRPYNPLEDPAYIEQVNTVAEAIRGTIDTEVRTTRGALLAAAGGWEEASRVDLWAGLRKSMAAAGGEVRDEVLAHTRQSWQGRDPMDISNGVCNRTLAWLATDAYGSAQKGFAQNRDHVDFRVGSDLTKLIDSGSLADPRTLDTVTLTIRAMIGHGVYKFGQWENSDQLDAALHVLEQYAARVPGFDPELAGYNVALASVTHIQAVLLADNTSKPHYTHAKPERDYLGGAAYKNLNTLARIQAHSLVHSAAKTGTIGELLADARTQVAAHRDSLKPVTAGAPYTSLHAKS